MKIQIHNDLRDPQTITVTRVVVLDDFDNPVALAVEVGNGMILAETAENTVAFNNMLHSLGIRQTVIVHDAKQSPLPSIEIPRV